MAKGVEDELQSSATDDRLSRNSKRQQSAHDRTYNVNEIQTKLFIPLNFVYNHIRITLYRCILITLIGY